MKAIINCKIISADSIIENKALVFDEKIIDFQELESFEKIKGNFDEIIDAGGNYVAPGFIDMHIHGSGGFDTMDGTVDAIEGLSKTIVKNGVTGFLATTMTMNSEKIYAALDSIRSVMKSETKGAKVLGAHLEGPFINKKYKGAQPEAFIVAPSFKFIENYLDVLKLITLAPELDENFDFIKEVKAKTNIILSIGHSNAEYEEAMEAIKCGVSHSTHTFNAMTPLTHRKPGIVGAVFNSDIYSEIIADGIHTHTGIFNTLKKIKGKDRIILITDSMRAGCLKDGISELGGQTVIVKDNSARLEDGTLAGSILKLNYGIKNFFKNTDLNICEVIGLVSINPAKELGIFKDKGSIEIGKFADLVIINDDFDVKQTIVEGKILYSNM